MNKELNLLQSVYDGLRREKDSAKVALDIYVNDDFFQGCFQEAIYFISMIENNTIRCGNWCGKILRADASEEEYPVFCSTSCEESYLSGN